MVQRKTAGECEGSDLGLGRGLEEKGGIKRLASNLRPDSQRAKQAVCVCVLQTGLERRRRGWGWGPMGGASGQHLARLGWGKGERGGAEGGRGCY